MLIEWKPEMPIAAYVEYTLNNPSFTHVGRPRTILIKTSYGEIKRTVLPRDDDPKLSTNPKPRRIKDMHLVEGTLEMQCSLLQRLARQENAAKGLTGETPGQTQGNPIALAALEKEKLELIQALDSIWITRRKDTRFPKSNKKF